MRPATAPSAVRWRQVRLVFRPLAPGQFDLEAALFAGSVGLGTGALCWHASGLLWPRCWLRSLAGVPCPFCGVTHAGLALLHGDVLRAVQLNPLATVTYAAVGLYDLYAVMSMACGRRRLRLTGFNQHGKKVLLPVAWFLVAVNWVYLLAQGWRG